MKEKFIFTGVIYLTGHTLKDTNKHRRNTVTEAVHDSITSHPAAGKDDSDSEEDSREEEEEEDCWRAVFNPDIIATEVTIKQEPPDSDDDQQAGVVRNTEGIQPTDHNTSIVVHIGNTEKSGETLIDPVETGKGTQESQNNGRGQKANTDSLKRSSAPSKSSEKKKMQLKGKVTKENKKDSESFLGDFVPCATCGKTFQSKTALSRHQQSHSEDRPHKCSWCGKGFKVLSSLQAHHRVHTGEKPFECKVCYKAFGDIGSCRRHEKTHDPQTPFQCEYCGKGFAENSQLTRHIRIHTGEKPYPCGTCEKRFSDKGQLKRHERRHLKGQERAAYNGQCDVCGKVLQDASSLKRHSLLHTNEKPYTCQLCGKAFRERSTLRQHGRMHDRLDKDVISCVNCGKGFKNIQTFNDHTVKCNNSSLDQSVSLEIENVALNPVIKEEV